jgi:hypothetical protein
VMTLIKCKHIEHATQKELMDPRVHMVLIVVVVQWNKICEELQKFIKNKLSKNKNMCKDKWNGINSNFKKLSNYHKGTRHHTSYWKLIIDKCDKYHLF